MSNLNPITIEPLDAEMLFIEAVRYAFGRMTYASSETAKIVRKHINELSPKACWIIARDVRQGIEDYKLSMEEGFGWYTDSSYEMDVKPWEDMLPKLDERAKLCA